MNLVTGLLICFFALGYQVSAYYKFEKQVEQEKVILHEQVNRVKRITYICGVFVGISPVIIVPPPLDGLLTISIGILIWTAISIWGLTKSVERGIGRLATEYEYKTD